MADPFASGGLGYAGVVGFGPEGEGYANAGRVSAMGRSNPRRLLKDLSYVHPTLDLALDVLLNLACNPEDVRITAVQEGASGEETDDAGTRRLAAMFDGLSTEVGSLNGLQRMLTIEAAFSGIALLEAVPGRRGTGVDQLYPVDGLSLAPARDADGTLLIQQRQRRPVGKTAPDGLVTLDPGTCFWDALNKSVDNPMGRPWFLTASNEALCDFAMFRDIRAAIHLTGNPRYSQSFPLQELIAYAMAPVRDPDDPEQNPNAEYGLGMSLDDAQGFADAEFMKVQETAGRLLSDDVWFFVKGGEITILDGAKGLQALEKMVVVLRQRLSQSVKTPGTLLGVSDGSTDTFSNKELEVYAARLETIRHTVLQPIRKACELCLRLSGSTSKVKVQTRHIRATDALVQAQTEAQWQTVDFQDTMAGLRSIDDLSERRTGSAPADPEKAEAFFAAPLATTPQVVEAPTAKTFSYPKGDKPRAAA